MKSFHCINGANVPDSLTDATSPAQLAFLALNGSYGEKLVASLLLASIAKDKPEQTVKHAFPKGRWT